MPISIAGTKTSVPLASSGSEVTAGPGQNPDRPQPMPNSPAPMMNSRVDILRCRQREPLGQDGSRPLEGEPVTEEGHGNRADHHEDEARIERAGEVEKILHLRGIGHARDEKAKAEDETGERVDDGAHGQPPTTWRMTKTVMKPVVMKIAVATSERIDNRAMPHTPCPLVQPPP